MSLETNIPVSSFRTEGTLAEQALQYPYLHPEGSFFTDGEIVTLLPSDFAEFQSQADAILTAQGLPLISERIPVLAYGSNRSPKQMSDKMAGEYGKNAQAEMQVAPMLEVRLRGLEVVWHGNPGIKSTFAELYKDEGSNDSISKAYVQYLTPQQLAVIHTTEGLSYAVQSVTADTLDGSVIKALAYTPKDTNILMKDEKPVRVTGTSADGQDAASMTNREAIQYMLDHTGGIAGTNDPLEFVTNNMPGGLPLEQRKKVRGDITATLSELGLASVYSFPESGTRVLRGMFSFDNGDVTRQPSFITKEGKRLPFIQMPEQILSALRPAASSILERAAELENKGKDPAEALRQARRELDIVSKIRDQSHDEIGKRLEHGSW